MKTLSRITFALLLFFSSTLIFSQSWFLQETGTKMTLTSVYFINQNTGWVGAFNGIILKTTNGGINWLLLNTGVSNNIWSIHFFDGFTGFACGESGTVIKTTNGGVNWSFQQSGSNSNLYKIRFINNLTGWTTGSGFSNHAICRTTNGGINWIQQSTNGGNSIFPLTETTIFADNSSAIMKSTNSGLNWFTVFSFPLYNIFDIYFINSTTGFAVGNDYPGPLILRSVNGGQNWSRINTLGYGTLWSVYFVNETFGWSCTDRGEMIRTTNSGANWSYENIDFLNQSSLFDVFFTDLSTGWAVGDSGKIIKTTNGGNPIGIEPILNMFPERFSLYQNYPNPFNPTTQINFDIPKSTFVSLIVFDAIGKNVADLVNTNLSAGSYSYNWNASEYPSGVYFYKLTAGDFTETKKMILIK